LAILDDQSIGRRNRIERKARVDMVDAPAMQ